MSTKKYKFEPLRQYLTACGKGRLSLSFAEIDSIIQTKLCKSAYTYSAYRYPSTTHMLPKAIIEAGYKVIHPDLHGMSIDVERQ